MSRDDERTKTALILVPAHGEGGTGGVKALRRLPDGMTWLLEQFQMDGEPLRYVVIGSWSGCQVVLEDRTVSRQHCILETRPSGEVVVHDCGSKNGTRINGTPVQTALLLEGSLLSVGQVTLLACNEKAQTARLVMTVSSMRTLINNALLVYGSVRKAAQALGVSPSTLQGWKSGKFQSES